MIEAVLAYILYAQMPTSLNFAINSVHHEILGFAINPVSFQALNPFWVVISRSGTGGDLHPTLRV